jgi:hypothetical protein
VVDPFVTLAARSCDFCAVVQVASPFARNRVQGGDVVGLVLQHELFGFLVEPLPVVLCRPCSLRGRLGAQGPGRLRPVPASFDAGNGLEVTRLRQTMVEQVLLRPAVDLGVFGLDRLLIERRGRRGAGEL